MLQRSIVQQSKRSFTSIQNFKTPSGSVQKTNLLGFPLESLQSELAGLQHSKKFTALQIWQHMYKKGYTKFEDMPNISKDLQLELNRKYEINYGEVKVSFIFKSITVEVELNMVTVG
jgi:23S rRNA (adenine2503-C2)-methyltransferase